MLLVLLLLLVWAALVAMWIAAIVSAVRLPEAAFATTGRHRNATIILLVITGWLGAAYYWLVIKRDIAPAA